VLSVRQILRLTKIKAERIVFLFQGFNLCLGQNPPNPEGKVNCPPRRPVLLEKTTSLSCPSKIADFGQFKLLAIQN
jgi:hypothetical protein